MSDQLQYVLPNIPKKLKDMGDNTYAEVVALGAGTAGSPSGAVQSVQGVTNGTAVTVAVSTSDTMIGALTETAPATDTASSGLNGRLQRIAQRLTSLIALLPSSIGQKAKASALGVAFASDQVGTAGTPATDVLTMQGVSGGIPVDQGVGATFSTLTRPANTTAYTANDSISDNPTAGSVTALVATIATVNDAPFVLTHINVETTDTGLGNGIGIRAYVYNSDPTANSGVGGGDNAAFSNKLAGRVATFTGTFLAASDGGVAHLAPENTGPPVLFPASGDKKLWIQFQALASFTPSANSTTLIARARGVQLRA